jgi:hypothetical protein
VIKETPVLNGFTLSEAVNYLDKILKSKGGQVNILFNLRPKTEVALEDIDPLTGLSRPVLRGIVHGLPVGKEVVEDDYDPTKIKMRGAPIPFKNVTVIQLLEIICMTAERPTRYYITDFGIIFEQTTKEEASLFTRRFNINLIRIKR